MRTDVASVLWLVVDLVEEVGLVEVVFEEEELVLLDDDEREELVLEREELVLLLLLDVVFATVEVVDVVDLAVVVVVDVEVCWAAMQPQASVVVSPVAAALVVPGQLVD